MGDIVSRLRATDKHLVMDLRSIDVALNLEAADEIERLRARLNILGAAALAACMAWKGSQLVVVREKLDALRAALDGPDKGGEDASKTN